MVIILFIQVQQFSYYLYMYYNIKQSITIKLNKMEIMNQDVHEITYQSVNSFRMTLQEDQQYLQSLISSSNDTDNQLLLELHFLMTQLQKFFDDPVESDQNSQHSQVLAGEMQVIPEGASDKQISHSTLKHRNNNDKRIPKMGSFHSASFSSPNHCSKQSYGSLHHPELIETPSQKPQDLQDAIQKYYAALKTISSITTQKSMLEQMISQMKDRIFQVQKEKQEILAQKNHYEDLFVKHTQKNNHFDAQNRIMRKNFHQLETKCRALEEQLQQKGELLGEVRQFLRGDDEEMRLKQSKHYVSDDNNQNYQVIQQQNYRLNVQITRIFEELQVANSQNQELKQKCNEMEISIDTLLKDNQQFYLQLQDLSKQLKQESNKNRELIKIEQGKRLNDMVHKENKHLLQVNYELGNTIYQIKAQNQKLVRQLQVAENSLEKTYQKSRINMTQQTVSYTPKNISFKGSTADKFMKHIQMSGQTEDNQKSRFIQHSLRLQKEKNRQLQEKVSQLMEEMAAYEQQLGVRKREIQRLNLSPLIDNQSNIENSHHMEGSGLSANLFQTFKGNQDVQEQQFISLKQFCQKFQPSPMDILFIMLRVAEICESMFEKKIVYELSPSNVLLTLDDPAHPENIFIKIEGEADQEQVVLFISPETAGQSTRYATESSVVWNMGMVFYYLLQKVPYFQSVQDLIEQNDVILTKNKFPQVEQIIECMLQREAQNRLSMKDALELIAGEINKMLEQQQQQNQE